MKVILSIAGSDSSGGAGIQADIKTAEAHGCFMTTALTAVTAQNTLGVTAVQTIDAEIIKKQIQSVLEDFEVSVVKIGMLGSKESIEAVKEALKGFKGHVILDPVAISRAGSKLLDDDAINALQAFFHEVSIITPNRHESELFFGIKDFSEESMHTSIKEAAYKAAVIIKNFEPTERDSKDIFIKGEVAKVLTCSKASSTNTHGTGCTYSTALACNIALGHDLLSAAKLAKNYVYKAISYAPQLGRGNGPITHNLQAHS